MDILACIQVSIQMWLYQRPFLTNYLKLQQLPLFITSTPLLHFIFPKDKQHLLDYKCTSIAFLNAYSKPKPQRKVWHLVGAQKKKLVEWRNV